MANENDIQVTIDELISNPAVRRSNWADIARQGVIVNLHIGYWRPYARLDPEDLGLPKLTADQNKLMKLGVKSLVRQPWLDKLLIEGAARRNLKRLAFDISGRYFVPVTAYAAWRERNEEIKAAFFKVRDEMIASWEEIVRDVYVVYEVAAEAAWPTASAVSPDVALAGRSAFIKNYVERIAAQLPTKNEVYAMFTYTSDLTFIEGSVAPATTGLDVLDADIKAEAERRRSELADQFVTGVLSEMNMIVYDLALGVLTNLNSAGRMMPGDTKALRSVIDRSPLLNFMDDPEMGAMIAEVRRIADEPADKRNMDHVAAMMRHIAVIGRHRLVGLGRDIPSARTLGVPDTVDTTTLRQARVALSLVAEEDLSMPLRSGRIGPEDEDIQIDVPALERMAR